MKRLNPDKALVLFSGGQDSAITLAGALSKYASVETIGFDYGQRHIVELEARIAVRAHIAAAFPDWGRKLGPDTIVDLAGLGRMTESSLTRDVDIGTAGTGLPTTFVPGRNLAFLVLAGAFAYSHDAGVLVAGMCEADYSGYPDCREAALGAQMEALRLGLDADLALDTPLMRVSKARSWRLAEELGGVKLVDIIRTQTHSCYLGVRTELHDWGYGCGACPACVLRAQGWRGYAGGSK